jgi:hypothetical protein
MTRTRWAVLMSAVLGAVPTVVSASPPVAAPVSAGSCSPTNVVECGEDRYCYDAPNPWIHGYFQETPAYAGFHAFRPYNYKHVFAQSQLAAGWGASPTAPYSHQFGRLNSQTLNSPTK